MQQLSNNTKHNNTISWNRTVNKALSKPPITLEIGEYLGTKEDYINFYLTNKAITRNLDTLLDERKTTFKNYLENLNKIYDLPVLLNSLQNKIDEAVSSTKIHAICNLAEYLYKHLSDTLHHNEHYGKKLITKPISFDELLKGCKEILGDDLSQKIECLLLVSQGDINILPDDLRDKFRSDTDIQLLMITLDYREFYFNDHMPKNDKNFILKAIKKDHKVLKLIDDNLLRDAQFMLEAIGQDSSALIYAHSSLTKNKDFMLQAIEKNRDMLYNPNCIIPRGIIPENIYLQN